MKIKALVLSVILCAAALPSAHAFGVGAQFNFNAGRVFAPGASLLISPSDMTNLALNWYLDSDSVSTVGLTADVVPLVLKITSIGSGSFNFTLGAGLYANLIFDDDLGFDGGLRVPVGLNMLLGKNVFEIFVHVAPSFGISFMPSMGLSDPFFPVALGARIWFR